MKIHINEQNLLIQDWMTTTVAVHDSTVAKAQIDSGQGYKYFLASGCVMFNILNNHPHRKVVDIAGCY